MASYALLILPSANKVYANAASGLACAELEVFNEKALNGRLREISTVTVGGVPCISFSADELTERDMLVLSNASTAYALFRRDGVLLEPIDLRRLDMLDDDLITIQRYRGKTNEQFTKVLLNVTLMSTEFAPELTTRKFRILDPVAGRGTTLNQVLMYGFDAAGIEIDRKDFDAYSNFMKTWLQNKRLKHRTETGTLRMHKQSLGRRFHVEFGVSKDLFKEGKTLSLTLINADTVLANEFFKPRSFDALVGDMPYGVQHGSRTSDKGLSRRPVDLLRTALPVWSGLLRTGGAIGISWNVHGGRREDAIGLFEEAGLDVCNHGAYRAFAHRVDQAIKRDILVAVKR